MRMNFVPNIIEDIESWKKYAPPMGKDKHWRDGRSAKELARYITSSLPSIPQEICDSIPPICNFDGDTNFQWEAEYITEFVKFGYGTGRGRTHDTIIYNEKIFIGIEAKADEKFGREISQELSEAKSNKMMRINNLCALLFRDGTTNHLNIRYQLVHALSGILLEANARKINNAMLLIIIFNKSGRDQNGKLYFDQKTAHKNHEDLANFLKALSADENDMVQTEYGYQKKINVYVKEIVIELPASCQE